MVNPINSECTEMSQGAELERVYTEMFQGAELLQYEAGKGMIIKKDNKIQLIYFETEDTYKSLIDIEVNNTFYRENKDKYNIDKAITGIIGGEIKYLSLEVNKYTEYPVIKHIILDFKEIKWSFMEEYMPDYVYSKLKELLKEVNKEGYIKYLDCMYRDIKNSPYIFREKE